jgi:hypothetical protein
LELCGALLAVIGLTFAVQAGAFPRPSSSQLVAAKVVKELLRYPVMHATEYGDGMKISTVCLEELVVVPRAEHRELASLVVTQGGQRYYDLGHGIRVLPDARSRPTDAHERFMLAACPALLADRISARLADRKRIVVKAASIDGVSAVELEFGRAPTTIELFVEHRTLRPVWLTVGRDGGGSDLQPATNSEQIEPAMSTAFKKRVRVA